MAKNNAKLFDYNTYIQAGINPKNGLPIKLSGETALKENIKKLLRIMDEQTAVNRYKWYNIPFGMSSQEIERLIYYKGQLAGFYIEEKDKFFLLPFALSGGLDEIARFEKIHPIPISSTGGEGKKTILEKYFASLSLNVLYDVVLPEQLLEDPDKYIKGSCVILRDYTQQISQTVIPRSELMDPLLDVMANCVPFMNTALMNSTGVSGIRVKNADESAQVDLASRSLYAAALRGEKWMPMTGALDFQDLSGSTVAKSEEFLMAMQSLDNFRLYLYGLDNGGIYQKRAHMLQSEQDMNAGSQSGGLKDGLDHRQRFCNIFNSVWGVDMWCETSEEVLNVDLDGDGLAAGDNDNETIGGDDDVG